MYNKAHTTDSCDIHFAAEDLHKTLLIILPFKIQFFFARMEQQVHVTLVVQALVHSDFSYWL